MSMEENNSDAQAIIDHTLEHAGLDIFQNPRIDTIAALPKGLRLERVGELLESLQERPQRRRGTVRLTEEQSFVAWVNRNSLRPESCIYAQAEKIECVVNDDTLTDDGHEAGWRDYRAEYSLPKSRAWHAWTLASERPMSQGGFAEFIEDRIMDVLPPESVGESASSIAEQLGVAVASPSALMALSRGLSVRVNSKVTNAVNLSTGEAQLEYGEEHVGEKGAPLKVPGAFAIGIPVFERGALYSMPVRLRYRVKEGRVMWTIQLLRQDESYEHALGEVIERIAQGTQLPVFRGEAPRVR
jgi:uncharacterized protein YfdQ (DUF2303 family)